MHLMWTSDLETGIGRIDEQHRELFQMLGDFRAACDDGQAQVVVGNAVAYLEKHVEEHFTLEEIHMLANDYAGYPEHKAAHDAMRVELRDLVETIHREGPKPSVVTRACFFLAGWLRIHIGEMDKAMAKWLSADTKAHLSA